MRGQDLYGQKHIWKNVGINARGRMRQLNIIYRNTREIAGFANRFRFGAQNAGAEVTPQTSLFPDPRISSGPCPTLKQFDRTGKVIDHIAKEIKALLDAGSFPLSEIAVMYTMKRAEPAGSLCVPEQVAVAFDWFGVLKKWLSEDYRAKRSHDITANSVTITTIHSAKGLDFACVFLIGLDVMEPGERWPHEQIDSLAYVGITRVMYQLEIPYVRKNGLLTRLLAAAKALSALIPSGQFLSFRTYCSWSVVSIVPGRVRRTNEMASDGLKPNSTSSRAAIVPIGPIPPRQWSSTFPPTDSIVLSRGPLLSQFPSKRSSGIPTSRIGKWCHSIPLLTRREGRVGMPSISSANSSIRVTMASAPQFEMTSKSASRSRSQVTPE